jgi:hypothetical protein
MMVVTKAHHGEHLCRMADGSICVDALSLADDLRSGYGLLKKQMHGECRERIEARFSDFRDTYGGIHRARQKWFAAVPQRHAMAGGGVDPVTPDRSYPPNSPSLNPAYSTNVTGVPRLDDDANGRVFLGDRPYAQDRRDGRRKTRHRTISNCT